MKRLFDGKAGEIITPTEMRKILEQVNRESNDLTFVAHKAILMSFRGQEIQLAQGSVFFVAVGSRGGSLNRQDGLFVISKNEDVRFYGEQNDVFRRGFAGCKYTVFFANPKKIAANQALQHNDPSCHESCLRTPRASRGRG